jgi:hypothetical protein
MLYPTELQAPPCILQTLHGVLTIKVSMLQSLLQHGGCFHLRKPPPHPASIKNQFAVATAAVVQAASDIYQMIFQCDGKQVKRSLNNSRFRARGLRIPKSRLQAI